jgi:4-amino-4-deoxy-L-arabinose transferase-like glycosyltransferase
MPVLKNIAAAINRRAYAFSKVMEIKNPFLKNLFSVLFFLLALHLFYNYIGVYKYIHERPCSIHASAQCQRASVARNYYEIDMNFFEPRIQRFRQDDGITGIEFPIIYYTAAVLYKCFGFNETYLRAISLIIVSAGFLFFYLLSLKILKSNVLALVTTGAAMVSPVLLYYSANFMPDAPAFGLVLCAWFFFFRYTGSGKNTHLWLFVAFGVFGTLIKAVSFLCFAVVLCLLVLDRLRMFKRENEPYLFRAKRKMIVAIAIGTAVVFSWYVYAQWLTRVHDNASFALRPVLVRDMESLLQVYHTVRNVWLFQYYSYETYVLLACAVALIIFGG